MLNHLGISFGMEGLINLRMHLIIIFFEVLSMHRIIQLQLNAILLVLLWWFNMGARGIHRGPLEISLKMSQRHLKSTHASPRNQEITEFLLSLPTTPAHTSSSPLGGAKVGLQK